MYKLNRNILLFITALLCFGLFTSSLYAAPREKPPTVVIPIEKSFYLTTTRATAVDAPTECADGYHFASIFEVLDISNLVYNPTLGAQLEDSGYGPPEGSAGWIRTGTGSDHIANCNAWTSDASADGGAVAVINNVIYGGLDNVWAIILDAQCNLANRVWCVSDSTY